MLSKTNHHRSLKQINLFVFICLFLFSASVSAQTFAWAKRFAGLNATVQPPSWDRGLAMDGAGNLYSISGFSGTVDFNPGTAVYNLNAANGGSSIQKIDALGNFVWAKQLTSFIKSVAVDNAGNVFLSGTFTATQDLDPGPAAFNLTSFGHEDVFVLKLDVSGNFAWAKQVGGSVRENNNAITVSASGNIYVTGGFGYAGSNSSGMTADFDPDPINTNTLTTVGGGYDGFLLALDNAGNFLWVDQKGSVSSDAVGYVVTDAAQNIYCNAYFNGGTLLEKIDASNNIIWSINLTFGPDIYAIAIDPNQNVLLAGNYWGTYDFDPGPGVTTLSSPNYQAMYNAKFDANANFLWATTVKANSHANTIATDASGNVYTAGCFHMNGTFDFDPGAGVFNLKNIGTGAMFIQKLAPGGGFLWAGQIGGEARTNTTGRGIVLGASSEIITLFSFSGTIDIDPGSSKNTLKALGNTDMAIHKITQTSGSSTVYFNDIVSETIEIKTINAYPNPNHGSFYMDVPAIGEDAKIEIHNMAGQLILTRSFNGNTAQRLFINEKIKATGMYSVRVSSKEKIFITKISIQ